MLTFGEELFKLSRNLMISVGSWQLTEDMGSRNRLIYKIYSYLSFFISFGFIISGTIHFFIEMLSYKNYEKGIELMGLNTILIIMYIKLGTYKSNTVTSLIKEFIQMTNKSGNINSTAKGIVQKKIKYCIFINMSVLILNFVVTIYYSINGILDFKKSEKEQNEIGALNHLLYIYYPFQSYINIVCYIEKIIGMYLACYNAACLTLLNTIIVSVVIQLQVLQYEFSNYDRLHPSSSEISDTTHLPPIIRLNKLIKKHQYLLSYSSILNEALQIPILIEYSISSISIATFLVQILKGSGTSLYIIMVLLVTLQLLVFCLNAHDIVVESIRLGDAAYFSNWYGRDISVQKNILIIMMRSRVPMHVSIGPFGILNAESFISILKVAYSYVSLLSREK